MNMKYYDIHVDYDGTKDGDGYSIYGYSIFVKANVSNEDEVLQYAIDNHLFEEDGDEKYVDYVEEIDEEDYADAFLKVQANVFKTQAPHNENTSTIVQNMNGDFEDEEDINI